MEVAVGPKRRGRRRNGKKRENKTENKKNIARREGKLVTFLPQQVEAEDE